MTDNPGQILQSPLLFKIDSSPYKNSVQVLIPSRLSENKSSVKNLAAKTPIFTWETEIKASILRIYTMVV